MLYLFPIYVLTPPAQATFVTKVTVRVKTKEKVITGCWLTKERMKTDLKLPEYLVKLIYITSRPPKSRRLIAPNKSSNIIFTP